MLTKDDIESIIDLMNEIDAMAKQLKKPNTSKVDMARGFEISHLATAQQEQVAMTPLMKNALQKWDHFGSDKRLMVNDPPTKAERVIRDDCIEQLKRYNGKKRSYNKSLPLDSKDHYDVDCWDNLKDNMRDITPGQQEMRAEAISVFAEPSKHVDIRGMLRHDPVFAKAVEMVMESIPSVKSSDDIVEVSIPFMNKDSNVSYPYWFNDKLKGPSGKTYAEITLEEAKRISLSEVPNYNISTAYGRNQRSKGRLIIAISRIVNLVLNKLESQEIAAYKEKSPIFVGYNDDVKLQEALTTVLHQCEANNWKCANWDQKNYDQHVPYELILLVGAISTLKANDKQGKNIAKIRSALATKSWLIDGISGNLTEIHGRIFSGFIDTNRMGGLVNAIITTYCVMKQDRNYANIFYNSPYYMMVMGDDNLFIYNNFDHDQFVSDMAKLGFDVHPDKQQFGPFFLQNRLYKKGDQLVMTYPWTRVVRSMLFKEQSKGLGPYGWELAFWQQLSKLIQDSDALECAVRVLYPYDNLHFCVDLPIDQLLEKVRLEDQEALKKDKRAKTVVQTLYDGDPTKARQFTPDGSSFDTGFLAEVQGAIRAAVSKISEN